MHFQLLSSDGARDRIWTGDLSLTMGALYQLSYVGHFLSGFHRHLFKSKVKKVKTQIFLPFKYRLWAFFYKVPFLYFISFHLYKLKKIILSLYTKNSIFELFSLMVFHLISY